MKLLVLGQLRSERLSIPAEITDVLWGWENVNQKPELCLVEENLLERWFACPAARDAVTAIYGPGQNSAALVRALQSGAMGYLLPPYDPAEIQSLLKRMIGRRQEQNRMALYHALAEESFWMRLITQKFPNHPEGIAAQARQFGVDTAGMIQPLFVRYRAKVDPAAEPEPQQMDMEDRICGQMQEIFGLSFPHVQLLTVAPHKLIVLLFARQVEQPFRRARQAAKEFLKTCPALGVDALCLMGDPANAENLAGQVEQLLRVGNNQVYLDNQFLPSRQEKRQLEHPPQPNVNKYLALLDSGMYQAAYTELRSYFYTPSVMPKVNNSFLTNFHYQLMDGLRELRIARKCGVNVMQNIPDGISNAAGDTVQDFLDYFSLILRELEALERTNMVRRNVVEEVKIHVLDHLDGDLSREQIAQRFYLSADYLGRLFRKSCGVTLTEYVLQARLQMAKQLLAKQELLISDVAYKTGFLSASQLSRVFKKSEGLTPNEYRKQQRNDER